MCISKENAEKLAVVYSAYTDATNVENWHDIVFWGAFLADLQDELDVDLVPTARDMADMARRRVKREERK